MDPRDLNRAIGQALHLVWRRPDCPRCRKALAYLNHARRLAKAGYSRQVVGFAVGLAWVNVRRAQA